MERNNEDGPGYIGFKPTGEENARYRKAAKESGYRTLTAFLKAACDALAGSGEPAREVAKTSLEVSLLRAVRGGSKKMLGDLATLAEECERDADVRRVVHHLVALLRRRVGQHRAKGRRAPRKSGGGA